MYIIILIIIVIILIHIIINYINFMCKINVQFQREQRKYTHKGRVCIYTNVYTSYIHAHICIARVKGSPCPGYTVKKSPGCRK